MNRLLRSVAGFMQRRLLGYEVEVLSFSQAGEDLIVRNVFYRRLSAREPGFYVDIGAYHPYKHSNTYYLYRCGWRGINIDARPGSMRPFDRLRPRDVNLEFAIASEEGSAEYHDIPMNPVLGSFSRDYLARLGNLSSVDRIIRLPTRRLARVLEEYLPEGQQIDFLSIDIEGMELSVLQSNDWTRYRPRLIAAEVYGQSVTDILTEPVSRYLLDRGYDFYTRVVLSTPCINTVFYIE